MVKAQPIRLSLYQGQKSYLSFLLIYVIFKCNTFWFLFSFSFVKQTISICAFTLASNMKWIIYTKSLLAKFLQADCYFPNWTFWINLLDCSNFELFGLWCQTGHLTSPMHCSTVGCSDPPSNIFPLPWLSIGNHSNTNTYLSKFRIEENRYAPLCRAKVTFLSTAVPAKTWSALSSRAIKAHCAKSQSAEGAEDGQCKPRQSLD